MSELADGLLRVLRTEVGLHHGGYIDTVTTSHETDDVKMDKTAGDKASQDDKAQRSPPRSTGSRRATVTLPERQRDESRVLGVIVRPA